MTNPYLNLTDKPITGAMVARETGLSYKKVDRWAREEILVPSLDPGLGSGSVRHYTEYDVMVAKVLKPLSEGGLKKPVLQKIGKQLYSRHFWWRYRWLIIDDTHECWLHGDVALNTDFLKEQGGAFWLLDLNALMKSSV